MIAVLARVAFATVAIPMSLNGDALPPQNLEAERAVLGGILIDNDALPDVVRLLTVEDFYRDSHQAIYREARDLYLAGKRVDTIILADALERAGRLDDVGGYEALAEIVNGVPHAANTLYWADIVRNKAVVRGLIEAAAAIQRDGYANPPARSAPEQLELAERRIFALRDSESAGGDVSGPDAALRAMELFSRRQAGEPVGLSTGLPELDDVLGGLEAPRLYVVAGRPSLGKTSLALTILESVVGAQGVPALMFTLEMDAAELAMRRIQAIASLDAGMIRGRHRVSDEEMGRIAAAYATVRDTPLAYDHSAYQTPSSITANARRHKLRRGIGLVVIDYLQLIDAESDETRGYSVQEKVEKISKRMKELAKELHVPVVLLSQLNRKAEDRADHRPGLADLRSSGAIEQDADAVILIHRPEFYYADESPGVAELIVAKNRSGPTDTVRVGYRKRYMRFESLDRVIADGTAF